VRQVLVEHGAAAPVWLTEFGWSTCNVRNQVEAYRNCVSESRQATYLDQAFRHMRDWSWVPVGIWFNTQDTAADPSSKLHNFGLRRFDGSRKPAFKAFRAIATARSAGAAGSSGARGLTLDAAARSGGIRAAGQSPADAVLVRFYRYRRSNDRFASKPRVRLRTPVRDDRYRVLAPADDLRRGRWKVLASTTVQGEDLHRRDELRWRP
jgi:hypothetical protein